MELTPDIKSYEWGQIGLQSEVARLAVANAPELKAVCETQPNAEWWIGDHVSGPAKVKATGESLSEVIARNPALVGGDENAKLPFLLKVLSIQKALSIQVHPSKVS